MDFLTTRQVAELTGIPEATLRFWRHLGTTGPASFALGPRRVVYRRSEIDRWIAEQEEAEKSRRAGDAQYNAEVVA